jgi:hypothetical protein
MKEDDWSEQIYTVYADGTTAVENFWYHDEDWYDYDYERMEFSADGVETYWEFTDAWGNTNTESWDEFGNEYYGLHCDPPEEEL